MRLLLFTHTHTLTHTHTHITHTHTHHINRGKQGGLTGLRNPMALISLRSGRLCSKVVDLSLNPVFNAYAIICVTDDPLVLVEVLDDDKSGDGMYGGQGTSLLGSVILSGDVLKPPAAGKEKCLWLPLSSLPIAPSDASREPQILLSVMSYSKHNCNHALAGEAMQPILPQPSSYMPPSGPPTGGPPPLAASTGAALGYMPQVTPSRTLAPPQPLDDWHFKSALVEAQLREAEEWFKDDDVVKLVEGGRRARASNFDVPAPVMEELHNTHTAQQHQDAASPLVVLGALRGGGMHGSGASKSDSYIGEIITM